MDFIQSFITRLIKVLKIRLIQKLGAIRLPTSSNTSMYFFARSICNNLLNKNLDNNYAKINFIQSLIIRLIQKVGLYSFAYQH
jgi:hypothetical protein